MTSMTTCLWFDTEAEEAAALYCEVFGGEVTRVDRYGEQMPGEAGTVLSVMFTVAGMAFVALNGGPMHAGHFSEAFSVQVHCDSQEQADGYWAALTAEGEESMCGWLKDRYGFSWQIIPPGFDELFGDPDPVRSQAAAQAMMQMHRLDIAEMRAAADAASSAAPA